MMYGAIADLGSRQPIPLDSTRFLQQGNMRAELIEIQKADLGRKYARVDRRPLDPPPVALLKLYQILNSGTNEEMEREVTNYDDIQSLGLVCTVDLFPVPANEYARRRASLDDHSSGSSSGSGSSTPRSFSESDSRLGSQSVPPSVISSSDFSGSDPHSDDVVHHVNNYPVVEGSKVTGTLVGATFVQPNLVEYQGKKSLVFVFADLAVKTEGHFILRYRVFDIYSRPRVMPEEKVLMQAECYGGPFRVYSTKEFPGLQASTELTKHLARWGVRLNIRETERRRRKKSQCESPPYTTKAMKRKWQLDTAHAPQDDDNGEGVSDDD